MRCLFRLFRLIMQLLIVKKKRFFIDFSPDVWRCHFWRSSCWGLTSLVKQKYHGLSVSMGMALRCISRTRSHRYGFHTFVPFLLQTRIAAQRPLKPWPFNHPFPVFESVESISWIGCAMCQVFQIPVKKENDNPIILWIFLVINVTGFLMSFEYELTSDSVYPKALLVIVNFWFVYF